MDRLGYILGRDKVLKSVVTASQLKLVLLEKWDLIFGKFAKEVHFGYYREGRLSVRVENPMWITELKFYEEHVQKQINLYLAEVFAKSVRVVSLRFYFEVEKVEEMEVKTKEKLVGDLRSRVIFENEKRRQSGMVLCPRCGTVFVDQEWCSFCRCEYGVLKP